jgi:hypothetical protein
MLPRRATLVAGAGTVLAVAGCDAGSDTSTEASAGSPGPSGSAGTASAAASTSADTALVERVVTALRRAERVASGHGSLELAALHRAHLEALDAEPPAGRAPRRGPSVRRTEQQLHATLVAAATDASSGTLARLLASMSAAVAQRLALPETVA